ncbi:hypothetical protein QVD17_18101 [Tagetes erecta]|uniref:Secreted protein n=1 Tax=Tagetes erecta TaxID=13708 RepID=A0AAD8KGY3_TARER|nr:hypothetical protein QVD17_18101 [Tagetes erecta]
MFIILCLTLNIVWLISFVRRFNCRGRKYCSGETSSKLQSQRMLTLTLLRAKLVGVKNSSTNHYRKKTMTKSFKLLV